MRRKTLLLAGALVGSAGLSLGVGTAIAHSAFGQTTTTNPSSGSSTTAPSQAPQHGNCPHMGGSSSSSSSTSGA